VLGAAGVVGLLVIAAGYLGYTSLTSGYYLGAEGDKVVVFEGTDKQLLGFPKPAKAPAKEQPSLTLADLPDTEKKKIRDKSIRHDDLGAIRKEIARLEGACRISLRVQDDTVVIIRGEGQPGCPTAPLTRDPDSGDAIPRPDLKTLPPTALTQAQGKEYKTVQDAIAELVNLQQRAEDCRATPAQNNDCPK